MALRSRLYTRFRNSCETDTEDITKKINVVSLDADIDHFIVSHPRIQIKVFNINELDPFVDYITSKITDIYLFISNVTSNTLIPYISECPQLTSIYILCKNEHKFNYSNVETKLRGIFHNLEIMLQQFQEDISKQSTFQKVNAESAEFLWRRFFDKVLQHIRHTNIAKGEFTSFCEQVYSNNKGALMWIEAFNKDYKSDRVFFWYTLDIFLYRLLNRALRTQKNFNNIFKFRLILTDLVSSLKTAQSDHHHSIHHPLRIYRGQCMSIEEIQYLKSAVGNSILSNQFLSTTFSIDLALIFAEGYSPIEGVLFTIEVDSSNVNNQTSPFADISSLSAYREEEEVLFSMYSTFIVQSVQLGEENIWQVHLKFVDNSWDTDFGERSIFNPHTDQIFIRNLSKENKQSIEYQLSLDMTLRLVQTEYAKDELLEFCRSKYKDDSTELKKIDDFEISYRSEDAVKWYTRDSFLYRLLNESLRIKIIDYIVKMRYFIHDLHNQLTQLQPSFIQSLNGQKKLTLYRGQTMKINQLDELRENRDSLVSMNSFLSATQDEAVAKAFSGDGITTNPDEISVIYEMAIDPDIRSTAYAKIESVMADEQEILFSMGSVFRIEEVDELSDRMYRVKLTMIHREDELWNKLTAHLD